MVEAGSRVNWTVFETGVADKIFFYYAPKIGMFARASIDAKRRRALGAVYDGFVAQTGNPNNRDGGVSKPGDLTVIQCSPSATSTRR